jgi:N-ethylmaleimide reductase
MMRRTRAERWFGASYGLSNPDLVERFANGWPLNPEAGPELWYAFDAHGYTDFPRYKSS